MIRLLAILLCLLGISTQPTSQPSVDEAMTQRDLSAVAVDRAKEALAAAEANAGAEFSSLESTKSLIAELSEAESELAAARAGADAPRKVAASGRYNTLRLRLERNRKDYVEHDDEVVNAAIALRAAEATLSDKAAALSAAEKSVADAAALRVASDPIAIAIKKKELLVGMTFAQAKAAVGDNPKLAASDGSRKVYQWDVYIEVMRQELIGGGRTGGTVVSVPEPMFSHTYFGTFVDGKLVSFERLGRAPQ